MLFYYRLHYIDVSGSFQGRECMTVIGIDIGGSTTKIVGIREGFLMKPIQVTATDPVTSLYGAFGRYMSENGLDLKDVSEIRLTGVGASHFKGDIYGIKTEKTNEFQCIGLGGLHLTRLDSAIIVSMGTGTAFVRADGCNISHIGGTGVGGGTLLGLSSKLLQIRNFASICDLAQGGNLDNVDLAVGDISQDSSEKLTRKTTASNFGKISDYAGKEDIALGLINMVFQTVGMTAAFACRSVGVNDVVLCGNLTTIPDALSFFDVIHELHGVNFHLPQHAEYATALGAALSGFDGKVYSE